MQPAQQGIIRDIIAVKDVNADTRMASDMFLPFPEKSNVIPSHLAKTPEIMPVRAMILQEKTICIKFLFTHPVKLLIVLSQHDDIRIIIPWYETVMADCSKQGAAVQGI